MAEINLVGKTILGYSVTEKINSGTFGTVYKVEKSDYSGNYIRALKHITIPTQKQYMSVLNSMGGNVSKADNYFSEKLNEIVSEIQILNALSEKGIDHIVRYYDHEIITSESPKRYDIYILMEYLTPLEDYIAANEYTVRDVIQLSFDVLEGLKSCHDNGIWHRDIKDDNIFVSNNGDYKIGDFGVSKVLKDSAKAESLKGTPNYLAPEVYLGKSGYTQNVDLYALGIVIYRLLNYGRNPFIPKFPEQYFSQDEDIAFEKRMKGEEPELPILGGDSLGEVIIKSISNSNERFQNAEEFIKGLEEAVNNLDREVLVQSIKIDIQDSSNKQANNNIDEYRETLGEKWNNLSNNTLEDDNQAQINKHLFDSIGDQSSNLSNELIDNSVLNEFDISNQDGLNKENKIIDDNKKSVIKDNYHEDIAVIDKSVTRKIVFVIPFIIVLIGLIVYFFVIPKVYGHVISFFDWLFLDSDNIIQTIKDPDLLFNAINYIKFIRFFWYLWLSLFIASLFFVGKQLQTKEEPNSIDSILTKKQAYFLAKDITETMKLVSQNDSNQDFKELLKSLKRLEERLSVESDFGYGKKEVIDCENEIAKQLQYLIDTIPNLSGGNTNEKVTKLKQSIVKINSLLSKRMELKRK